MFQEPTINLTPSYCVTEKMLLILRVGRGVSNMTVYRDAAGVVYTIVQFNVVLSYQVVIYITYTCVHILNIMYIYVNSQVNKSLSLIYIWHKSCKLPENKFPLRMCVCLCVLLKPYL